MVGAIMDREPLNPYAAPAVALEDESAVPAAASFKALSPLAQIVAVVFIVTALFNAASVVSAVATLQATKDIAAGADEDLRKAAEQRSGLLAVADLAVALPTVILFCVFVARANRNAWTLRPRTRLEFTPGWAVGWFFIPLANLWKPYQAMREIWRASQEDNDPRLAWDMAPIPAIVPCWWGLYIGQSIVGRIASRLAGRDSDGAALLETQAWAEIVAGILGIAAALVAAAMVRQLARLQDGRERVRMAA
jgi:Domain of unknown function (DUF4328)